MQIVYTYLCKLGLAEWAGKPAYLNQKENQLKQLTRKEKKK